MFSKGKSGAKLLENNAILHHFHVGRLFATGGPEGVWKIYEGYYKTDGKVSNESLSINNSQINRSTSKFTRVLEYKILHTNWIVS